MSREAEAAVLGAMMLANDAYWKVADRLTGEDFSEPANRRLFNLIADQVRKGEPADAVTIGEQNEDLFGLAISLASTTPSAANAGAYADIVRAHAEARRLKRAGQAIVACESYEAAQAILAQVRPQQSQRVKSAKDGLAEMVDALQRRYDADGEVSGIPTGVASLDALTSGWQPGNLVVLAARPGMGKSAMALQAAMAAGRTLFFSLEMTAGELMERAVANMGALPHRWLRFPKDAPDHALGLISSTSREVAKLPLLIDDSTGLSGDAICSRARQAHMAEPLKLVIVDHLGLIDRPGRHDPSELGAITSQLKRLAKDLGITVVLLCQLNRGLESRPDKRPQLSDLRDSGRIEEDADLVIAMYREEYYTPNGPLNGYLELIVRKNRSGEQGTAWAKSLLSCMRLESTDEPERPAAPIRNNGANAGFSARTNQGRKPPEVP